MPSDVSPLSFRFISYKSKLELAKALTPASFILFPVSYKVFKLVKVSHEAIILHPIGPILL
jgi:hypothetical protein